MMRKIFTTILVFTIGTVFGQVGTLELVNPGTRVGDKIELKVLFEAKDLDALDSKTGKTREESELITNNKLGTGEIKLSQPASDTGVVSVGPLKLTVQNVEYVTNTIAVKIYPALPSDIKDGLWMRIINYNDENFLIIEQRISNKGTKKKTGGNEAIISIGDSGVNYFELDEEKFEELGIDIITSNSKTHSQVAGKSDVSGSETVSYKQVVYKFKKTIAFAKPIKVDRKLFKVFPENGYNEGVWIK
jgi:hypothetical protein